MKVCPIVKPLAIWLTCHFRTTLSLPTTKGTDTHSPANRHLADQITSIFESKPREQAIELTESTVTSLGLAEAAAFSQAAYCQSVRDLYWTCGKACIKYPDVYIQWTAGSSYELPFAYVARSKALQAVVVAFAGTNFYSTESWLADLDVDLVPVNEQLKRLDTDDDNSRILVHNGFYEVWDKLDGAILEQVQMPFSETGYSTVLVTGHSQGAALAQIEAVALRNELPSDISVENIGFGCPRLGNQRWADLVDSRLGSAQIHVVSYDDAVAHVPPAFLTDYRHAGNEIWIDRENEKTFLCRGQETDACAMSVALAGIDAHAGPYFGVSISVSECPE